MGGIKVHRVFAEALGGGGDRDGGPASAPLTRSLVHDPLRPAEQGCLDLHDLGLAINDLVDDHDQPAVAPPRTFSPFADLLCGDDLNAGIGVMWIKRRIAQMRM